MIVTKNWKLVLTVAAILGLTLTLEARANGGPGPRGPGGPPPHGDGPGHGLLHFGRLVEQLIFPCRNDCVQAEQSCTETAESDALSCAAQTCDATIQSARTDCAASRASQACLADISTLITCVQPCLTTQATAVTACVATYRTCVGVCSPTPTPTP